ncbi:TetR/AcrR family transcriptional regulator [Hoyosella subflava]|uniref:Transcriptional regulator, TetR family n=1 Tax=Hoyosella subflava (strain DSM 45089 / JCM 17490 / NBRC 109087 / DQS3-9A1) TaxID=443218 RepID=F6EIY5_HOYSD|nr:TetR/AcrR family transcriptional regulator [Hoyosella subflava]AEF40046.1 Transcriptional regulator, TetR family [Hoyosella subflava DQS3-9A1]
MTTERHKVKRDPPEHSSSDRPPLDRQKGIDVDAVLDAARECVIAVGWRRTTLTDVARRAGISRMSIYRKWQDMTRLMSDVMAREWSNSSGVHLLAGNDADRLTPENVSAAVVEVATAVRENLLFQKVVEVDPELLLPYVLHRRGRAQNSLLSVLEAAVKAGQDAQKLRQGDPRGVARTVLTAMQGFVFSGKTMTDSLTANELSEQYRQLIERYLTP